MFGFELPKKQFTPKDQYFHDVRRAYTAAERTLFETEYSVPVQQKIAKLGWSNQVRQQFGVGSVDYAYFSDRLIKGHGFDKNFLKKIGLLEPRLFGTHLLTFTLRDEYGEPVGFSARNLNYERAKASWEDVCRQFGENSEDAQQMRERVPPKYFNSVQGSESRDGSPILNKGQRLFGFHKAKLGGAPLYVFEGYADVVTAHQFGLTSCVGVSSAGLTKEQLELILRYEIPHIVLCLDADQGGWKGIQTFLKTLDRVALPAWFRADIMLLPNGTDDPDAYIRSYGVEAFQRLPTYDAFTWKVEELIASTVSEQDRLNKLIDLIKQEPSPLKKWWKAGIIAARTSIPAAVLYEEASARTGNLTHGRV